MGYIAKALVKIQDANTRHRVFDKVVKMGYEMGLTDPYGIHPYILIGENIATIRAKNVVDKGYSNKPPIRSERHIDCNAYTPNGTEEEAIKLFLELAQMDGDDAATLWVSMDRPMEQVGVDTWIETTYHKNWSSSNELIEATCEGWITTLSPLEVAEAFRDGEINL